MRINNGLIESVIGSDNSGKLKVRIRLISVGQGSSGFYPAETLRRDGPSAFPAGTKLFYNHPSVQEQESHRDVRLIFGQTISDAEFVESEQALYADAEILNRDADFIRDIMESADLSIEAGGSIEDGNVIELEYHPTNAVALVPEGGRDGKITGLIEAHLKSISTLISECGNINSDSSPILKENLDMTIEEIKAVVQEALSAFQESLLEAMEPVKKEVVETDIKSVAKALKDADLPEDMEDMALATEDPLAAIESFKTIKAQIVESVAAPKNEQKSTYVVTESGTKDSGRIAPTSWKK